MKTITVLLSFAICLATVNCRNLDRNEQDSFDGLHTRKEQDHSAMPHRRKRHYPYEYRRDYDRNHELLTKMLELISDLSEYVKRTQYAPAPQPQPIFIPYPVQLPQSCRPNPNDPPIQTDTRFPIVDTNRLWGAPLGDESDYDDEGDGSRPVKFNPVASVNPGFAPPVEHGTIQAGVQSNQTPRIPFTTTTVAPLADNSCSAAIIICCKSNRQTRRSCFKQYGCESGFGRSEVCSRKSIGTSIDSLTSAYGPVNKT